MLCKPKEAKSQREIRRHTQTDRQTESRNGDGVLLTYEILITSMCVICELW